MRRLVISTLAHALAAHALGLFCLLPLGAAAAQSRSASPTALAQAQRHLDALDVAACISAELPVERAELAVIVYPDGRWAFSVGPVDWPGHRVAGSMLNPLRDCLEVAFRSAAGTLAFTRPPRRPSLVTRTWVTSHPTVVEVEPSDAPAGRPDGREGAICGWGERRQDRMQLPAPHLCRPGLTCCAGGGAAGSDSVCMRVQAGFCPRYP